MYKVNAWIKEDGIAVRWIREGFDTISEAYTEIENELMNENSEILEVHITKGI